jgi:Abnormal spindle-like microcephaly-assoc'd, ASPM-SPD-2-Hydin
VLNTSSIVCGFQVSFTPTATGTRIGSLTINSTGGTQYATLVGIGEASFVSVALSPSSLTFPTQAVNQGSGYMGATITNTGTATLDLTGMTLTGSNPESFLLQGGNCGTTVAPGASCVVYVQFQPLLRGVRTATLNISDNAPNSPQTLPLSGTGTANSLSSNYLNFHNVSVGSSSTLQLSLTNVGAGPTAIGRVRIAGTDAGDFSQSNDCGSSLASKAYCTFTVTFAPVATGVRHASLQFVNNGTGKIATTSVLLLGTGK